MEEGGKFKAKILIVEDEGITALNIKNLLIQWDYEVISIVNNGEKAIKKTAETNPDLILMDIRLEGEVDGIDAAKEILNCFDVPIVYLTAHSDKQTLERAKLTYPFGYITKPFDDKELFSTIELAFHKHSMERKLKESEKNLKAF